MAKIIAVTNPKSGQLFTANEANTHVTLRLESHNIDSTTGYVNLRKVVTFVRVPVEAKEAFASAANLPANVQLPPNEDGKYPTKEFPFGLQGVIQVQEAHEPFYEGQIAKINPNTGEVITSNGKPVYRQTVFLTNATAPTKVFGSVVESESGKRNFVANVQNEVQVVESESVTPTPTATPAQAFTSEVPS